MELKQIFDKVRHDFNNSAEAWNKGLTVDYTIFTTDKDNITYQWEITILYLRMKCISHVN